MAMFSSKLRRAAEKATSKATGYMPKRKLAASKRPGMAMKMKKPRRSAPLAKYGKSFAPAKMSMSPVRAGRRISKMPKVPKRSMQKIRQGST